MMLTLGTIAIPQCQKLKNDPIKINFSRDYGKLATRSKLQAMIVLISFLCSVAKTKRHIIPVFFLSLESLFLFIQHLL